MLLGLLFNLGNTALLITVRDSAYLACHTYFVPDGYQKHCTKFIINETHVWAIWPLSVEVVNRVAVKPLLEISLKLGN